MKKQKKVLLLLGLTVIIAVFNEFFLKQRYGFINTLFFIGWIYLIIGAFEYVMAKGVLDFMIYSNRKFWQRFSPKKSNQIIYKDVFDYKASKEEMVIDYLFLILGISQIAVSFIFSFIYI